MNLQQKRLERERLILDAAWRLAGEHGFLTLKVSDLAKAASVSIGTLYSHFDSKEDLIIAMAIDAWQDKLTYIQQIIELDLSAAERVVAVTVALYLFDRENPDYFEAQQLAAVPSIWRKASPQRHRLMLDLCNGFEGQLQPLADEAIRAGEFGTDAEPLTASIVEHSQITLAVGNAYVSNIFLPDTEREEMHCRQQQDMPHSVMAAFRGFGFQREDMQSLYQRLSYECLRLIPQRNRPDTTPDNAAARTTQQSSNL